MPDQSSSGASWRRELAAALRDEPAREDVAERYPASRIARRTADLYERLLAR